MHSEHNDLECVLELAPLRFAEAHRQLDAISAQWDEAIGRLQAMVKGQPD